MTRGATILRIFYWALALLLLGPYGCSERVSVPTLAVACGSSGLESEPCSVVGETCPCSGFECPTYHDGFCTAVCANDLVWTLEDCARALPPHISAAGAGGEAGASGAAGMAP